MPTASAIWARNSGSSYLSLIASSARATASSIRSISLTESPFLDLNRFLSAPVTMPIAACSALTESGSQPACRATANTIARCCDCSEPTT